MAVVGASDLKKYMSGIHMSSMNEEAADLVLAGVQSELERYINRSIEARHIREVAPVNEDGIAYLSQSPVHEVLRITQVDSSVYTSPGEVVTLDPIIPASGDAQPIYDVVPVNYGRDLLVPGGVVAGVASGVTGYAVIEYVGGGGDFLAPYLPAIRLAILRVASREFQQMNDDTMSLRNVNATPPVDPIPVGRRGWQDEELRQFDRIRRRVVM